MCWNLLCPITTVLKITVPQNSYAEIPVCRLTASLGKSLLWIHCNNFFITLLLQFTFLCLQGNSNLRHRLLSTGISVISKSFLSLLLLTWIKPSVWALWAILYAYANKAKQIGLFNREGWKICGHNLPMSLWFKQKCQKTYSNGNLNVLTRNP